MKFRVATIAIAAAVALTITSIAIASGDDDDETDTSGSTTSQDGSFVGLPLEDAVALAEAEQRVWRIAREDDTDFVLTDDLHPGRVTFAVDDGIVTRADFETANVDPPPSTGVPEDPNRAMLIANAVLRLVTVDNGFGGATNVFHDYRVATVIGSEGTLLAALDLELIATAMQDLGSVKFIDDAEGEIDTLFETSPAGVAVVVVQRVDLLDDRAEVELRLWCGSLCGVFLTYEAAPVDGGWEITGITGPIAMS